MRGAVLVSQRGGDFLFDCGQDLSIGYDSHDEQVVRLYLQESFSFQVATADAAVPLVSHARERQQLGQRVVDVAGQRARVGQRLAVGVDTEASPLADRRHADRHRMPIASGTIG